MNFEYSLSVAHSFDASNELVDEASDTAGGGKGPSGAAATPLRSQKARISSRALEAFYAWSQKNVFIEPPELAFFQRCHFAP